jgi:hypothetical protein
VRLHLRPVLPFRDYFCLRETLLDIATRAPRRSADVSALRYSGRAATAASSAPLCGRRWKDEWRVVGGSAIEVDYERQTLVLDLHELRSFISDAL